MNRSSLVFHHVQCVLSLKKYAGLPQIRLIRSKRQFKKDGKQKFVISNDGQKSLDKQLMNIRSNEFEILHHNLYYA